MLSPSFLAAAEVTPSGESLKSLPVGGITSLGVALLLSLSFVTPPEKVKVSSSSPARPLMILLI